MFKNKEKEKTTILYKRIESLYNKQVEITFNGEYQSKLGERKFVINKEKDTDMYSCCCQYSVLPYFYRVKMIKEDKIEGVKVLLFGGEINKYKEDIIFELEVRKTTTKLKPCPINLTAHEINLAILEFENYVDKIYKEHIEKTRELEK